VPISDRHLDVLIALITRSGLVVSKDELVTAGWPDVAVTDNSLEQAISTLRRQLGPAADGTPYIETVPRRGYRFAAAVTRSLTRESDERIEALLEPHRAWLQGRAALETLTRDDVTAARAAFERVLTIQPEYAGAHVGAANALALQFQASRTDATPDVDAMAQAMTHARAACGLEGEWAEAWATLAFVLYSAGRHDEARAAARRAVMIEPDNWRHLLRLAYVSWGEERLRAAQRTLHLLPDLALAHWLTATVHVARGSFDAAEHALLAGTSAQDAQRGGRFAAVGLHWLRGLVFLHRDDVEGARQSFACELEFENSRHVYARECCANVWYAQGSIEHRRGNAAGASHALQEALRRAPRHPLARAAAGVWAGEVVDIDSAHAAALDAITVHDVERAAATLANALRTGPPGIAGWTIPVDPWLRCHDDPTAWATVLACIRNRAA
jgi:tetratricopeptide (TPR) repeat protein